MSWSVPFVSLLFISAYVDYYCSAAILRSESTSRKKIYVLISLIVNLGLLGFFKYTNFLFENANSFFNFLNIDYSCPVWNIILPLGISFYTFQTMSYTLDVYRGEKKTAKNLADFFLYISFFPQLIAGPIVRASEFLEQINPVKRINSEDIHSGLNLIFTGLIKKVLFADNISKLVEDFFSAPLQYNSVSAWIGVYAFAFQIYFDFSGYCDIAIGCARLLGFNLPKNFDIPYKAHNMREFWRRWHITLSTWLRDYLYISLGGSRCSKLKVYRNLLLTMILGGLWHGASWNFVIWGLYLGIILSITRYVEYSKFFEKIRKIDFIGEKLILIILNFHLVCVSWVFFRAESLSSSISIIKKMLFINSNGLFFGRSMSLVLFIFLIFYYIFYIIFEKRIQNLLNNKIFAILFYFSALVLLVLLSRVSQEFIYFQF
ncbi:MAG TPA: MBOAT family O-acyltransferase [bacterium]|nr:MBOAT family O-acyltransferase [bacterium]